MREPSLCALWPGPGLGSPVVETDHALRLRKSGGEVSRALGASMGSVPSL